MFEGCEVFLTGVGVTWEVGVLLTGVGVTWEVGVTVGVTWETVIVTVGCHD